MPMPRLIPRLTWTAVIMSLVLFVVSIFALSTIYFQVAERRANEVTQYLSDKISPIFSQPRYDLDEGKELTNKAELAKLVLNMIMRDNPFIPNKVNALIRVRDKTGEVFYRIEHPGKTLRISYRIVGPNKSGTIGNPVKSERRFFWDKHSVLKMTYSSMLMAQGKPIGAITLISPVDSGQLTFYIAPILLLSLIFLFAFACVAMGWFRRLKQNIDLLYLGLEKNLDNSDIAPPPYVYEEFWQVIQWNKAVSAQIQESLQFQSALFQNSPCGVFILDPQGKILEVNTRAWELLMRIEGAENIDSICDINENMQSIISRAMEGKTDAGELCVKGHDDAMTLIYAVSPIQLPSWRGAVMFWLDHTEMKKLDSHLRQTDRYQVIGELVSMAAHELRNPLTTIIANAQLGQIVRDEAKQQELFVRIQQASARMNDFIKDLLGLCRPGEAKLSPMGLYPILSEVIGLLRAQLLTQGIEVEIKYDEDTPQIWGEAKLLRQIFLNLIQNSIQAMPSGGRLIVKTKASVHEAIVTIQDTGGGIAPEIQGKIFESFITNKEHGTGLGLFITRRIMMQNFGGRIWFSSTPGEGTEFFLAFPLAEPLSQLLAEKSEKRYWTGKQTMIQ